MTECQDGRAEQRENIADLQGYPQGNRGVPPVQNTGTCSSFPRTKERTSQKDERE